jgi:uncharacterized protein YcfL
MKRKLTLLILTTFAVALMFGCSSTPQTSNVSESSTEATTTTTEATTTTTEATTTAKPVTESDFDITDYIVTFSYDKEDTHYFMIIKNNSTEAVKLDFNLTAYDSKDNVIGATDAYVFLVGPGEETIVYSYFDDVRGVHHVSRKMTIIEDVRFEPQIGKLESETHINKKNVVLTITNNGDNEATEFYAYLLFLDKNGKIVDCTSEEIYSLKPGEKYTKQFNTYLI